jgi:tellurite resistance protein TehA-like permease
MLATLILIALGIFFVAVPLYSTAQFIRRQAKADTAPRGELPTLLTLLLMIGAIFIAIAYILGEMDDYLASEDWQQTGAFVMEEAPNDSDSPISYGYMVGDTVFFGNRITFGDQNVPHDYDHQDYEEGDTLTAYYDPASPTEVTIERRIQTFPLVLLGYGALLLLTAVLLLMWLAGRLVLRFRQPL